MDSEESPQKRRKISPSGTLRPSESEDEDAFLHETVATLPLHSPDPLSQTPSNIHFTQPTQVIERSPTVSSPAPVRSAVQVVASSPLAQPARKGGFLASALAPAGTTFRAPTYPAPKPKPTAINVNSDSEDDGPKYVGGSSDEESTQDNTRNQPPKNGLSKIQEITKKAVYDPSRPNTSSLQGSVFDSRNRSDLGHSTLVTSGSRPSSDTMASAYGNVSRRPQAQKQSRTTVISEPPDMSVDDILDPQYRVKVKRILAIFPQQSVKKCYEALSKKKGHFEDAIDYLGSDSDKPVDLTVSSEDELQGTTPMVPRQKPIANKAPPKPTIKSIRERYGGTTESVKLKPSESSSTSQAKPPLKRLVQGRKHALSPPPTQSPAKALPVESSDSDASDSRLSDADKATFDGRLLKFFNSCSTRDLVDTASIENNIAEYIIQKRPFKSLEKICRIPAIKATATKKSRALPLGERVVDKCSIMLEGYEAVDALVKKCESLGKPLSQEMARWGVDIFGSASAGQLDFTRVSGSQHDSGIGTPASDSDDDMAKLIRNGSLFPQPRDMNPDKVLKDYQLVGFNWLYLLYRQKLSCLLSDDMGLGKTCQVIAFLAHLRESGEKGPHLVVVPSSTLENWLLEFRKFCPDLSIEPLHGSQSERFEIRDALEQDKEIIDVVITTYTMATSKDDYHFLKKYGFNCVVFDEGHMLKNSKSQQYTKLIKIGSKFRLLLTGTPVQNNLQELASLLGFILPDVFHEKKRELSAIFEHKVKTNSSNHEALLSQQRIDRARSMLTPFILRRQKHQVLKDLPPKVRHVEHCELNAVQTGIYETELARIRELWENRRAGVKDNKSANVLMKLRQAALHPMLFRRRYHDSMLPKIAKACLKDPQFKESSPDMIQLEIQEYSDLELHELCEPRAALSKFVLNDDAFMDSAKVAKLVELLRKFKEEGARTLIFSQFRMILNILERVLNTIEISFLRIDGETKTDERQPLIDQFYADKSIGVFLLTTKAGGAGINLAAANKVIIFDCSFNPQDDIQAENRAHRIGQARAVEVIRLVTRGTVEEQIYAMGQTKLALDQKVVGEEETLDGNKAEKKMEEMILEKLKEEKT